MKKVRKILLVDNDVITCYINSKLLEKMDVAEQIESVYNGKQALQYIRGKFIGAMKADHRPDLLFLDLKMPVMDGFNFLEELKKSDKIDSRSLTIIVLSSSEHKKDSMEAILNNSLVHSYLTKPLKEEKIKEIVESIHY